MASKSPSIKPKTGVPIRHSTYVTFIGLLWCAVYACVSTEETAPIDHYYGFGADTDHKKAIEMFSKQKNIQFLVLINLIGQGNNVEIEAAKWLYTKSAFGMQL